MTKVRLIAGALIALAIPSIVNAAGLTSGQSYPDVVRSDSPTGYWRLGEALGATSAEDASGRGHAGAYGWRVTPGVGGAIAGDPDTAARFPGPSPDGSLTGSDVTVPDAADLNFGTIDFTAEAWVRTDLVSVTTKFSEAGGESAIVGKSVGLSRPCFNGVPTDPRDISAPGWAVSITDDQDYAGRVRAVVSYAFDFDWCPTVYRVVAYGPDIRVDDGAWHYVAAVFQPAIGITVYVDGVAATTPRAWTADLSNPAALTIGSVSGIFPFSGDVDEPAVYDHALSPDRIEAHRQAGLTPPPGGPITPAADGTDTPGVVELNGSTSNWSLSNAFDATVKHSFASFCCGQVVAGDWDGDAIDSGAFMDGGHWTFNNGYDDIVDVTLDFGQASDVALAGDWNGDGIDTPGVRRGSAWYLSDTFAGSIDHTVDFGAASDKPVVGDWDGDGRDTIGVFTGTTWQLSNTLDGRLDATVTFGQPGDTPLAGDWNNDGRDTVGVRRGSTWYLSETLSGSVDHQFDFGTAAATPVVGDWDDDVTDETENVDSAPALRTTMGRTAVPDPVDRYALVVYLNEPQYTSDNFANPAAAYRYFIKRSQLKWARPGGGNNDDLIRGRGRVKASRLGGNGAGGYKAISLTSTGFAMTYYSWEYTRPKDSSSQRVPGLSQDEGFYLDLPNTTAARQGYADLTKTVVYYDYLPGRWIRYWYFYAFNDGGGPGNHEGDWEGVAVHLDRSNQPIEARLFRHKESCGVTVAWTDLESAGFGRRAVYAAKGSHGTYRGAGTDHTDRCHFGADETAQGTAWFTWVHLAPVRKQAWYGYGGAWGEPGSGGDTTGPLGPSRWKIGVPDGW